MTRSHARIASLLRVTDPRFGRYKSRFRGAEQCSGLRFTGVRQALSTAPRRIALVAPRPGF